MCLFAHIFNTDKLNNSSDENGDDLIPETNPI